ncbi:MAG: hypothetical protein GF393_12810, partial [Armatimonadia bacterium]|nr:hypothetical protein [Armatimonadia bacterium]
MGDKTYSLISDQFGGGSPQGDYFEVNVDAFTENEKALYVAVAPTDATHGTRQGAVQIAVTRATVMTSSDGNPDCGLKIAVKNQTASESYCRQRGLDISVKVDNSGSGSHSVYGGLITAEAESGTDLGGELIGLDVHCKNNGTATGGTVTALKVYDESQSSTGTNYAVYVDCTNNSAFTREYCVFLTSGASSGWTNGITFDGNFTNAFDFSDSDGTNGAKVVQATMDGYIADALIRVDIAGTAYYIPLFN